MHQSVLDKQYTLCLNKSWLPIGRKTIREAAITLCSEQNGEHPALALDMEIGEDELGNPVLVNVNPVPWEVWIFLPIRDGDLYIQTHNRRIRAPTVIVNSHYDKIPFRKPRLCSRAIWERDGGICQYTGQPVTRSTGDIDHVLPLNRGGKNAFDNMVVSSRAINSAKGDRLNSEVGLKLIRQPKSPPSLPVSATITEPAHSTWQFFLH